MSIGSTVSELVCSRLRTLFCTTIRQSRSFIAPTALAGCLFAGSGLTFPAAVMAQDAQVVDLAKEAADNEAAMLAVLRSDAPNAEKAIACKRLAVFGSGASVAEIAPLLANPELSSWARIALEAIPGKEADEALRSSAGSLQGRILVGVINSIGVRRDAGAVEVLIPHLKGQDAEAAAAAAVALGRIGTEPARLALLESLANPGDAAPVTAVAEGCILAAERLLADGQAEAAATVYDTVLNSQAPKPRILEATRGAIIARGEKGIPLLLEKLKSEDKGINQIALSTAREMEGNAVDAALAAELSNLEPERAALVVYAMADRTRTVNLEAILAAAGNGPVPVRIAAVQALRKIGNASCVPALIEIAQESNADLNALARLALAELPGKDVDSQISSQLSKASGKKFVLLIQLVGERRIDAVATLVKALENSDSTVRRAALVALGETVPLDKLSVLITQATSKKDAEETDLAFQALKTASIRMGDREACAAQLAAAVDKTGAVPAKCSLLEVLGAVGGTKALEAMNKAARSSTPELQDTSSRLLGEWMTEDAAPVLLDLAKTVPGEKYKVRALRGYIRIARQFVLPEDQRVQMCVRAMEVARQPAEKELVVEILKRYPSMDTLKLAIKSLDNPEVKTKASEATLVIASKIGTGNPEVVSLLKSANLEKVKIEIVKAEYGADANQKDVTDIIKASTGELALVTLPAETYNGAFGGDPAPGVQKKLRIQYRFNGKDGEVNLAENTIIILPAPGSEVKKK